MTDMFRTRESYILPPLFLLDKAHTREEEELEIKTTADKIGDTLLSFGVDATITDINRGPVYTRYVLKPGRKVRVREIVNLLDEIKLRVAAKEISIKAPIPGKSTIGIDVLNKTPSLLHLRELLESREFRNYRGKLPFAVGKDIEGRSVIYDLVSTPHLLLGGATGTGKSVFIHTVILSLLYTNSPKEVQFLMIDPQMVELPVYKRIPHLIIPVITDARKSSAALNWAVAEQEKRLKLFVAAGVRDFDGFNSFDSCVSSLYDDGESQYNPLPRLVIIINELADLMQAARSEVEEAIYRLTRLGRLAGIHLIISTQRPSGNVITGLIKANMLSRIAFAVPSQTDSRVILNAAGAEKLIGRGDMLFFPRDYKKPVRIQGAFVSDSEVSSVVHYISSHTTEDKCDDDMHPQVASQQKYIQLYGDHRTEREEVNNNWGRDEYFAEAGRFIIEKNKASIGLLQRVFKIGFNRAARIMDQLAEAGVVSEESSIRARQVLMTMVEFEQFLEEEL